LFRVHARKEPYLTGDEIDALRDASWQLAALARSVNQLLDALHTRADRSSLERAVEYGEIKNLIEAQRSEIKNLICASLKSWRSPNDDE
jgi:hypothetical protein